MTFKTSVVGQNAMCQYWDLEGDVAGWLHFSNTVWNLYKTYLPTSITLI